MAGCISCFAEAKNTISICLVFLKQSLFIVGLLNTCALTRQTWQNTNVLCIVITPTATCTLTLQFVRCFPSKCFFYSRIAECFIRSNLSLQEKRALRVTGGWRMQMLDQLLIRKNICGNACVRAYMRVCVSVHPLTCMSASSLAILEVTFEFLSWQGMCKF